MLLYHYFLRLGGTVVIVLCHIYHCLCIAHAPFFNLMPMKRLSISIDTSNFWRFARNYVSWGVTNYFWRWPNEVFLARHFLHAAGRCWCLISVDRCRKLVLHLVQVKFLWLKCRSRCSYHNKSEHASINLHKILMFNSCNVLSILNTNIELLKKLQSKDSSCLKRSCLAETLSAQQALKHFVMNDSDMYLIATEFPEFFTTLSAVVLRYMR